MSKTNDIIVLYYCINGNILKMYIFTDKDKFAICQMMTAMVKFYMMHEIPEELRRDEDGFDDNVHLEFKSFLEYNMNAFLFDPATSYSVFNISLSELDLQWSLHCRYPNDWKDESLAIFFDNDLARDKNNYPWMHHFSKRGYWDKPIYDLCSDLHAQQIKLNIDLFDLEEFFNKVKKAAQRK